MLRSFVINRPINTSRLFAFIFTSLIALSSYSSRSVKGFYKVPIKPELKHLEPYSTYPADYKANDLYNDPDTLNFRLPTALVGEPKLITINKIQGSTNDWSGPNVESGTCSTVDRRITCTLKFKNLDINMNQVQNSIEKTYTNKTEADNRLQVAEMFSSEPLGVVSYKYKKHEDNGDHDGDHHHGGGRRGHRN